MTIALIVNGVTFAYPEQDDEDWGPDATDWAAAVTAGMLQKAGGLFTLTADADFGASFGLKSLYYKTRTANPADAGQFRLAKTDTVVWRNTANSANLVLGINSSDQLIFDGVAILPAGITSLVGDVTGSGPGAATTTIANNVVTNAKLATMATATFKGRTTAGTGNAEDLTVTQATALLNVMVGDSGSGGTKGLVPAPATGDATKFLNGAGIWSIPSGAGDVTGPASAVANGVALFDSTTGKIIKDGGIGTSSQVFVGGTTPGFGNVPTAALPVATTAVAGIVSATTQIFSGDKTFLGVILAAAGSVSSPSLSFSADPNTGIYNLSADAIGFAGNGTFLASLTYVGSGSGSLALGRATLTAINEDHSCSGRWNMATASSGGRMGWVTDAVAGTTEYIRFSDGSSNNCGNISIDASANTTAYNTSSDKRLKTKIEDFDALELIRLMKPSKYERISNPGVTEYGFIAQELNEVLPQAVTSGEISRNKDGSKDESGIWCVDYGKVTGVLTKGIQELLQRINTLEKIIKTMEKQ